MNWGHNVNEDDITEGVDYVSYCSKRFQLSGSGFLNESAMKLDGLGESYTANVQMSRQGVIPSKSIVTMRTY